MANITGRKYYVVIQDQEYRKYMNKIMNTTVARKNFLRHVGIMGETVLKKEANEIQATGFLERGVRYVTGDYGVLIESQADYSLEALEVGVPPGTKVSTAALAKWVKKKGINISPFAIAKSIEKRGSKKHRDGGPRQVSRARDTIYNQVDSIVLEYIKDVYYD